jgi:hypothetical protein
VLSGKEELRLRPEVEKAIKEGTLLNTDKQQPFIDQIKSAPIQLPIIKDFSNYIKPTGEPYIRDTATHKLNLDSISPQIFLKYYGPKPTPQVELGSFSLEGLWDFDVAPRFNLTTDPLNKGGSIPLGKGSGSSKGATPSGTSFNDALEQLFSPAARAKARNRKNANAWKTYNNP